MATSLEAEFHQAMLRIYQEAKTFGYHATRFRMMLEEHGGVETARRLLNAANTQDGLTRLWDHQRLDLAVEYHVLQPRFHSLFDESIRSKAGERLNAFDYVVDEDGNLQRLGSA